MNALHRRPRFEANFPAEFWIVANLSELDHGYVCKTREDVRDRIEGFEKRGERWWVLCVGDGERGYDVTAEFVADDEPEEYAERHDADRRYKMTMEA
jgi:hypothetical protein